MFVNFMYTGKLFLNVFNFVMFINNFIYQIFTQINGTTCDLLHIHFTKLLLLNILTSDVDA